MTNKEIEPLYVPYEEQKIKLLNRSKRKLLKIIKRESAGNEITQFFKTELIKNIKGDFKLDYKFTLIFVLYFGQKYLAIKDKIESGNLDTKKLQNDSFWVNPSKELLIFFIYTLVNEKYNDYIAPHLLYLEDLQPQQIINEINKY